MSCAQLATIPALGRCPAGATAAAFPADGFNGPLGFSDTDFSAFTWPAANVPGARLDTLGVDAINVQTDGGCTKKPRIFNSDSQYDFDATETEPPNTNSFFGSGGYSIWAADTTQQKVRGCITISSGLGSDISKCLDMTFQ